jgi:hypothetical protein
VEGVFSDLEGRDKRAEGVLERKQGSQDGAQGPREAMDSFLTSLYDNRLCSQVCPKLDGVLFSNSYLQFLCGLS